ncbi:Hypothetical predicted protein, partial [Mytilus galloprovincialis]
ARIRCIEGVRLTSPLDTTIVTECGDHKACSIKQTQNLIGKPRWSHGCSEKT